MSWKGNKAVELVWMVGFEGLWVGGECGWVMGFQSHSSSSSPFPFLNPPSLQKGQLPKPRPDNNMGKEPSPVKQKRGEGKGRESFDGDHCGNVVNCAFLRPWESHTRAGTCGHGKRGLHPQREELSDAQQHLLITQGGGADRVHSVYSVSI